MEQSGQGRRCLVLGVNGQDGSYLAEHLLARGWIVDGAARQAASRWLPSSPGFTYHQVDLGDPRRYSDFLEATRPAAIFHVAAVHGAAGFRYEDVWFEAQMVNTVSVQASLEYLRRHCPQGIFLYASSSKAFGAGPSEVVSETTPRRSTCIYSITKNAATDLVGYYRRAHGLNAGVIWTFNHESPRRPPGYFIPRIVDILAAAITGSSEVEEVGSLQFWCDWGDASEFMEVFCDVAERAPGRDLVLATGKSTWAATLVTELFARFGLDAAAHVRERSQPPAVPPRPVQVDIAALREALGYTPRRTILQVCEDVLRFNHPEAWERRVGHP